MSLPSLKAFGARTMEFLFGRRLTPAEQEAAKAARPPEHIRTPFSVIRWIMLFAVLGTFLWSHGWLPFVRSRIDLNWFWLAFGVDVLQRFAWEQITKHYQGQTEARMTPTP